MSIEEVLSAATLGSVITIIVTKVFEAINNRTAFKRELEKMTYQRKLEKAEKAVAFLKSSGSRLRQFKNAVTSLIGSFEKQIFSVEMVLSDLDDLTKKFRAYEDVKNDEISAVFLYFDMPEDTWTDKDTVAFYDLMTKINAKDNPDFLKELKDFVVLLEAQERSSTTILNAIRNLVKR